MPQPAYVLLSAVGVVERCHHIPAGFGAGAPTNAPNDLENLISSGFQPVREVALDGGKVLVVLSKP
jgi:hypothetical protein